MAGHALVVGAGIYGLCTAWALVKRGWRVTIVDKGPIPNPVSSGAFLMLAPEPASGRTVRR